MKIHARYYNLIDDEILEKVIEKEFKDAIYEPHVIIEKYYSVTANASDKINLLIGCIARFILANLEHWGNYYGIGTSNKAVNYLFEYEPEIRKKVKMKISEILGGKR